MRERIVIGVQSTEPDAAARPTRRFRREIANCDSKPMSSVRVQNQTNPASCQAPSNQQITCKFRIALTRERPENSKLRFKANVQRRCTKRNEPKFVPSAQTNDRRTENYDSKPTSSVRAENQTNPTHAKRHRISRLPANPAPPSGANDWRLHCDRVHVSGPVCD
jgi:hypothetical protein